jgi:phosphopantetheine binding protein
MLAAIVMYKLRDAFNAEFPLMMIFENPTVRELAEAVEQFDGTDEDG